MGDYWVNIALVAVLVLLNAVFAGSEIALISLREGQLRQLDRRGGAAARTLVRLARDPNRFLATIQVGITLAGFLASAAAAVSLAEPLVAPLGFLGGAAEPVAIALVTVVLSFVTLVFGELAPKRLAMQFAERWAMLVARPLDVLSLVSRPAIWALGASTDLVVRTLGGDPRADKEQLSPEELRDLVAGHRGLTAEQRQIISGALEIHERTLREVLRPRREVFTLPDDQPTGRARTALAESGHSRAPVIAAGELDDVVGIANLRDLTTGDPAAPVAALARPAVVFPDSVRVSEALRRFKAEHQQLALVVDEHGGVEGIVTLEDLLEEIVGEIYDETDRDVLAVRTEPDGALLLPGTFPIHDLPDLGVEVADPPAGDYTTVAGLVLAKLRRVPERPGDRVGVSGWTIEVTDVDRHAITGVRMRPVRKSAGRRDAADTADPADRGDR
ncbi:MULTISPECIES: hemolysin family protein [Actinomadura]|uniref:hemolysin family protein n=1 Tax=Actinomadura TaxID=1988 RepID=UPI000425F136|nr:MULTISPECIES: hemolysin family protein [Actinomadura]RSN67336.1 HlyC/CorC family transporter [Actinomadura sp. WAC 06369]